MTESDKILMNIIAENIRKFRSEAGFSQLGFTAVCDISQSYLGEVETSRKFISVKKLNAIAKSLKKPVWLFLMTEDEQALNDTEQQMKYFQTKIPKLIAELSKEYSRKKEE